MGARILSAANMVCGLLALASSCERLSITPMNFAREVVEAAPPGNRALVELTRDGGRREWTFGDVTGAAAALAARLHWRGLRRRDVVLTLVGNRSEWVLAMVACFRLGLVALPRTEQLRPKDLAVRLRGARPPLLVCDRRHTAAPP